MAGPESPTIGACGIDCGLCPRYYPDGASRCPGCGGEGFGQKHPSCGFLTCCVKNKRLSVCAECGEFPCRRFDKEDGKRDSFVLHRRVMPNQYLIREIGLDAFLAKQAERMAFLDAALSRHDDGRSKGFYCIAAALLSAESLRKALGRAGNGENLRTVLSEYAAAEGQELRLVK
jgi:hypothetical protein